jgi:DNA-binding response OmpR family regulator
MAAKILVIEDNTSTAAILISQLKHAGFDALGAPDAMLGTKECVRWQPDLVILDLMLPAGGGVGVLRNIRQSMYSRNTPVIVLTGTSDPAARKQILDFGVSTFIQKPHDPVELIALIKKILGLEVAPT